MTLAQTRSVMKKTEDRLETSQLRGGFETIAEFRQGIIRVAATFPDKVTQRSKTGLTAVRYCVAARDVDYATYVGELQTQFGEPTSGATELTSGLRGQAARWAYDGCRVEVRAFRQAQWWDTGSDDLCVETKILPVPEKGNPDVMAEASTETTVAAASDEVPAPIVADAAPETVEPTPRAPEPEPVAVDNPPAAQSTAVVERAPVVVPDAAPAADAKAKADGDVEKPASNGDLDAAAHAANGNDSLKGALEDSSPEPDGRIAAQEAPLTNPPLESVSERSPVEPPKPPSGASPTTKKSSFWTPPSTGDKDTATPREAASEIADGALNPQADGLSVRTDSDVKRVAASGDTTEDGAPITAPRLIASTPAQYPATLRGRNMQARVVVRATVLTDGSVGRIEITECTRPGMGFENRVIAAVRMWRYEPARQNGVPVNAEILIPFSFE